MPALNFKPQFAAMVENGLRAKPDPKFRASAKLFGRGIASSLVTDWSYTPDSVPGIAANLAKRLPRACV
jgi:hypothetical protein